MNLVLSPAAEKLFQHYTDRLPQTLLISGPTGVGLATIARELARSHTKAIHFIEPTKDKKPDPAGHISIDAIRELYTSTRSQISGGRIILIDNADKMTHQAQNAFLKLLEEPNSSTSFILTSHEPGLLLPTVLSRLQEFNVQLITEPQSQALLDDLKITDSKVRAQLLFIAMGKPAELIRLSANQDKIAIYGQVIADARKLVQGSTYDKLVLIHSYKDDRQKAELLLDAVLKLLKMSLASGKNTAQVTGMMDKALTAIERLRQNGNVRLTLASFVL